MPRKTAADRAAAGFPPVRELARDYAVTMTFASPAWDERDGITITVRARSKAAAIKSARETMRDAGHMGKVSFRAVLADASSSPYTSTRYADEMPEADFYGESE